MNSQCSEAAFRFSAHIERRGIVDQADLPLRSQNLDQLRKVPPRRRQAGDVLHRRRTQPADLLG